MVDRDVYDSRSQLVAHELARLRARPPVDPGDLEAFLRHLADYVDPPEPTAPDGT